MVRPPSQLVRRDLYQARSEAGVISVHTTRVASAAVAIANSHGCQLAAVDDALQAAHVGAEEEKEVLRGSISHESK
jgi:hypothetical protein